MPLTKPIPNAAMPVGEVLRRDMERPTEIFKSEHTDSTVPQLRNREGKCPMGMHPQAKGDTPTNTVGFPVAGIDDKSIRAFFCWWDQQNDPAAAVEAVWPETTAEVTP